jgi:hypothetical protein
MTPDPNSKFFKVVMQNIGTAAQKVALRVADGELSADLVLVARVTDELTRVYVGERGELLPQLLDADVILPMHVDLMATPAPEGFFWLVIDWGDTVSAGMLAFGYDVHEVMARAAVAMGPMTTDPEEMN